jgi:hypothetical protein
MTFARNLFFTLLLGTALTAVQAAPVRAQDAAEEAAPAAEAEAAPAPAAPSVTVKDVSDDKEDAAPAASAGAPAAAPSVTSAPPAPAPAMEAPKPPEPPKQTGPVYNPPPPSGKDWGKLTQDTREGILNDWKALPEKDREPFIFYRERAMAKLPDSAYSDNPYKPDAPVSEEAKDLAAESKAAVTAAPAEDKPGFFDKLLGKDDE